MTLELPTEPESPNVRALAALQKERIVASAATITVDQPITDGLELVFRNGQFLDELDAVDGYTVSGTTITFTTPAVVGDIFHVWYYARSGT